MPNKQQSEQRKEEGMDVAQRETLDHLIRKQVMNALGTPIDLLHVQIRTLWEHHYRANVFVGVNTGSVRIANSFFLHMDSDGGLITSSPKITKQY